MNIATWIRRVAAALVLGVLLGTLLVVPVNVVPALADGGSGGQPGEPPPDTLVGKSYDDGATQYSVSLTEQSAVDAVNLATVVRIMGL